MSIHETNIPGLTIHVGPSRVDAVFEATIPAIMKTKDGLPATEDNPADVVVQPEENLTGRVLLYAGSLHERNVLAAWAWQLENPPTVTEDETKKSKKGK